jgi:membrane protein DedA with SNARE-associated domain
MSFLTEALAWIARTAITVISTLGYAGVFVLMAAESMIIPIPAELVMPFAGFLVAQAKFKMVYVFIASSLGSIAGSMISYWMGRKGGNRLVIHFGKFLLLDLADLKKTEAYFERKGEGTIFIGRLIPVVRHLISIPAGIGKMDLKKFTLYTFAGATLWNMFLAWLGYILGQNWNRIRHYTEPVSKVVVLLLVAGFAYFVYHHVKSKRLNRKLEKELTKN